MYCGLGDAKHEVVPLYQRNKRETPKTTSPAYEVAIGLTLLMVMVA